MEKQCVHCSAPIHKDASFCHVCEQSQITKHAPQLPKPRVQKRMMFLLLFILLLLPWSVNLLHWEKPEQQEQQEQEAYIPVKITWYDAAEQTGSRPKELQLIAEGIDYQSQTLLLEENGWTGKIKFSDAFSNEKSLEELYFDFLDSNGKDIDYTEEIRYENGALRVNLKYNMPFFVEWDDNYNRAGKRPETLYISMSGEGFGNSKFRCEFYYAVWNNSVPMERAYLDGSTVVEVYTDESRSEIIDGYVPSLSYDEQLCTLTLTMSLETKQESAETKQEFIPVHFDWYDDGDATENRPHEANLIIETSDSTYSYTTMIREEDGWSLELPKDDRLLNAKYLKDEVEFTLVDADGKEIPYAINAVYENGIMTLTARYEMLFEVVWETKTHPEEIYILLQAKHFRSGFTYIHPRPVRFYDEYIKGKVQVSVYDEYDRTKELTEYIPTLSYDSKNCSVTLFMKSSAT